MVKTIQRKEDLLQQELSRFFKLFKHSTFQEQENNYQNFKRSLFRLHNSFNNILEQEKDQINDEFKEEFNTLISKVKETKKKGQWQKNYFNLFTTLGYQRLEEVHSNILAWLLNQEEAHSLGDAFLRAFVKRVFNKDLPLYLDFKVNRESQEGEDRPDIVVEGNNWWLIIENKIYSTEQENQTLRYAERWGVKGNIGDNVLLAFISPSGWSPKSPDFKPVSYRTIRELLENMHFQEDSNFLICHFIDHIFLDLEG